MRIEFLLRIEENKLKMLRQANIESIGSHKEDHTQ